MRSRGSVFDEVVLYIEYGDTCGSGVLIPTLNQKWLCVLTAHHVLENAKELRFEKLNVKRLRKNQFEDVDLIWKQYFFDKEMDIAVLMAEYQEAYDLPVATLHEDDLMYMCGFPGILHDNERVKRFTLEGKVKEVSQEDLITSINDPLGTYESSEIDSLQCFSGSGIFASFGDGLVLAGIETEALTNDAAFHSVRNTPIAYIEKMIYAHMQDRFGQKTAVFGHRDISMQIKKSKAYSGIVCPLIDFRSQNQSVAELKKQYLAGINAHPDHIRNDFDFRRTHWLGQIKEQLDQSNIVIIKGASGQGKSTLAYRFLLDNYSEDQIVIMRKISNESDIGIAIKSLCQIQSENEVALLYDVQPGDTKWADFIEDLVKYGKEFYGKLLVTIRQEDYNRTKFDKSMFMVGEIELQLSEAEALELYQRYKSSDYISFADSWSKFGGHGPLLEYIFMLNHSETLTERIRGQIRRIEDTENSDEWIEILEVIALAGKHNHRINFERLFRLLPCRNQRALLQRFQKELFIKVSKEGKYIECLHIVRAEILFHVLRENIGFDYEKVLLRTLALIEDNPLYMMIEFFRENYCTFELIEKIASVEVVNIKVIRGVLRSLLWYEIFEFHNINQSILKEGDELLSNQFMLFGVGDTTGYLTGAENQHPSSTAIQLFEEWKPGIKDRIEELRKKLPRRQLTYEYVDLYLRLQLPYLEKCLNKKWDDISSIGYVLFWMANRGQDIHIKPESLPDIDILKQFSCDECLDLMKGLRLQKQVEIGELLKDKIFKFVLDKCSVVYYWFDKKEIFAQIICDPCTEELLKFNDICMQAVWVLRVFEPEMTRYNVQILGAEVEGLYVPDTQKNIPAESLYEKWITELNGISIRLQEYTNIPDDWKCVCDRSIERRRAIVDELTEYLRLIEKWYKKGKEWLDVEALKRLLQQREEGDPFIVPKCAKDEYGVIKEKQYISDERDGRDIDENGSIEKLSQRYFNGIDNFFRAIPGLLQEMINETSESTQKRLAFFNITDAYDSLLRYQRAFNRFFENYVYEFDTSTELSVVLKTMSVTRKMFQSLYRIEKNIVYDSTEEIKKEYRRIDAFLESRINKINGIRNVDNQGDVIVLTVSVECIDAFLSQIFSSVKSIIGARGEISVGEVYLKNKLHFFDVRYVLNETTIVTCKLPIMFFSISENLEKFKLYCRHENVIVKNVDGAVQYKVFVLLIDARDAIESINEQVFQINKALDHTIPVNSNEITLDRIDKSYQALIEGKRLGLLKALTLLEENGIEERQFTESIMEIVNSLSSYNKFIVKPITAAQELYSSMGECVKKINSILGGK